MDSNKDEAMRCVHLAEAALKSGDKQRALKFIKIAQRLDHNVPIFELLIACENLKSANSTCDAKEMISDYSGEQVRLVREIRRNNSDCYSILGVDKSCSFEEIKKAYKKLSLKVHPDKNKAPGSEEAFKIVCNAFKCLSNEESRSHYDQVSCRKANGFNYDDEYARKSRRRRTAASYDVFDENFNPDEISGSFYYGTKNNVFQTRQVHRAKTVPRRQGEQMFYRDVLFLIVLLQTLFIFLSLLLFLFSSSEPQYSIRKTYAYHVPMLIEKHGIEYFVKSSDFDHQFPHGSDARHKIEENVLKSYKSLLRRNCHIELQRRQRSRFSSLPHCDRLQSLEAT